MQTWVFTLREGAEGGGQVLVRDGGQSRRVFLVSLPVVIRGPRDGAIQAITMSTTYTLCQGGPDLLLVLSGTYLVAEHPKRFSLNSTGSVRGATRHL